MTNLIKTYSEIVEFYSSRNFIFYQGLIKRPKGYSSVKTKKMSTWDTKHEMNILSFFTPNLWF